MIDGIVPCVAGARVAFGGNIGPGILRSVGHTAVYRRRITARTRCATTAAGADRAACATRARRRSGAATGSDGVGASPAARARRRRARGTGGSRGSRRVGTTAGRLRLRVQTRIGRTSCEQSSDSQGSEENQPSRPRHMSAFSTSWANIETHDSGPGRAAPVPRPIYLAHVVPRQGTTVRSFSES